MFERYLTQLATDAAGLEDAGSIRNRLRGVFTAGFGRRATTLGLLVGGVLDKTAGPACDTIIYASAFGETRALADFLDTFPHPSPTLFQTSVHPSAVQQLMIDRKRPVREYVPLAGGPNLPARALAAACLSPSERVIFCGGEEKGTWMADCKMASGRAFAFSALLEKDRGLQCVGRVRLTQVPDAGKSRPNPPGLSLPELFEVLHDRKNFAGEISCDWRLEIEWT